MNQKNLSRWVRGVLVTVGVCGLAMLIWITSISGKETAGSFGGIPTAWTILLWCAAAPCYGVLAVGWRIAGSIGADRSFTSENAKRLVLCAWLLAGDGVFFFLGNLILLLSGRGEIGIAVLSLVPCFLAASCSVAAAALSHLVRKAAKLQEAEDLTI